MPNTMLQIAQAAQYLHLSEGEVRKLVMRREIPFEQSEDRPVFRRKDLQAWASQRLLGFKEKDLETFHGLSSTKHHDLSKEHAILPELFAPGHIKVPLAAKTRSAVLREMVDLADATGMLFMPDELLEMLDEREEMCSTALAGGFALLHPRYHDPYMFEDSFVCLGRSNLPIPYGAPDGERTELFFLVCCQDDRIHLHVLARLCMMAQRTGVLTELKESDDPAELFRIITASEASILPKA